MPNDLTQRLQTEYRTQDQEFAFFVGAMGLAVQEAQRRAGITNNKAWELMRDDTVLAYIEMLRAEHAKTLVVTKDDAVRGILRAVTQAHQQGDPKAQIGGWAEINKMHGFHAPEKHEHDVQVSAKIEVTQRQISEASTEDLLRILSEEDIEDAELVRDEPCRQPAIKNTSASSTAPAASASAKPARAPAKTSRATATRTTKRKSASRAK